jgi:hypothetical protein
MVVWVAVLAWGFGGGQEAPSATVSYSREVKPILSEHCFACHGPDEKTRKAGCGWIGLRRTRRCDRGIGRWLRGCGGRAALMARVTTDDPDEQSCRRPT